MNKSYRVIWNESTQTWQAVAEIATARGKKGKSAVIAQGSLDAVKKALALTLLATGGLAGAASVDGENVGGTLRNNIVVGADNETVASQVGNAQKSVVIGQGAKLIKNKDAAVGDGVDSAVAIGAGAEAGHKSIAIGGKWADGDGGASALATHAIAIGYDAVVSDTFNGNTKGSMAIGSHSTAISNSAGLSGDEKGEAAIALGHWAHAEGSQSLAIGSRARAEIKQATAIGNDTRATGQGAVVIGGDDTGSRNGTQFDGYSGA